ncbi:MAG: discoidin domain-containing protein, partial [Ignavibacteriaceae bacterium]|nr:discoidin domain-containing protein [Ignavibacteriaceae bacterium]
TPIEIIGEVPANANVMLAQIQDGTSSDGATFVNMFNIMGNITFKHVFIITADLNNSVGAWTFYQTANARVVMDSIVVDPVGWQSLLNTNADKKETYVTNSVFLRNGNTISPWDGWLFHSEGTRDINWDTLYVENNTFVNVALFIYHAENFTQGITNFIWLNHNTILYPKAELEYSYIKNSDFFTNNLLWQGCYDPFVDTWNESRPDGSARRLTSLFGVDTLTNESFPSQRKAFIEYNFNCIDPRINADIQLAAANNQNAYLRPLVMPSSVRDSSREAQMFYDKTNFPYFLNGNNIEYIPNSEPYKVGNSSFIDPGFKDSTIYAYTDSTVAWKTDSFKMELGLPADQYPSASAWPSMLFTKEPNGHNEGNPTVWPRVNGAYTNSQLLTASIEGLPLGDLNWFPEAKDVWLKNKSQVMNHILLQSETQLNLANAKDTAIASSIAASWAGPMNALDSNKTDWWSSGGHSTPDGEEWIYIDQRVAKTVAKVVLVPRQDGDSVMCFPQDFKIQYSSNGTDWTDVPGQSYTEYPSPKNQNGETFTFSSPISCRYIRIDATKLRPDYPFLAYWFCLAEFNLYNTATGVNGKTNEVVKSYSLSQNYPNPFNPTTIINYSIKKQGLVTLKIYNILGQEVASLVNQVQKAGNYNVNFNASKLASGVYMYKIQAGDFSLTKKMMLLK